MGMSGIVITQVRDWQVASRRLGSRFYAWAKMGKIQGDSPMTEPGCNVYFNSAETREEATRLVLDELGLSMGAA